jgi:phospho-N-acetylmuramoyl-pentapeptide-transferase
VLLQAVIALVVAATFVLAFGPIAIERLRRWCRDANSSPSATVRALHAAKLATPSMGGIMMVAAIAVAATLCASPGNPLVLLAMVVALGMAALGAADDLLKVNGRGLSRKQKLLGQTVVATIVAVAVNRLAAPGSNPWSILAAIIVIVASSNSVNLTDGLDGLAAGCTAVAGTALAAIFYFTATVPGQDETLVANSGEMLVIAASLVGACLGFLWFNRHPARVFMGDTGSLALGGLLGYLAAVSHCQILWCVVGGVFIVETLSVIVQIGWYRATGRRVFLCAPLHHHFQFLGWPETKIVRTFWMASAACAALGVVTSQMLFARPHRAEMHIATSQETKLR